ncbi:MAG: V-type sodium ATPase subunit G [Syntrophomonadaceae bacterium]|nr:V-type sodium ATPase subunit G [Bacillota bacterium]MBT9146769.1 V-type sodium ATPase subunit G [Bacillota bacterium]
MPKIAVVGRRDYIGGFAGAGASVFPVETIEETHQAFNNILSSDYTIIFLAEEFAAGLAETLARLAEAPLPIVTLIPDTQKSRGLATQTLKTNIRKAIGAEDISI